MLSTQDAIKKKKTVFYNFLKQSSNAFLPARTCSTYHNNCQFGFNFRAHLIEI